MLENLQRDVLVLMASRGIRAFAFSYLGVVFAIYLSQLGYSTVTIGLVISTASASGAVLTALWGFYPTASGAKILMLLATLTIISNLIYVFFSHLVFILSAVIIANVGAGGSGGGQGADLSIPLSRRYSQRNAPRKTEIISFPRTLSSARLWAPWVLW